MKYSDWNLLTKDEKQQVKFHRRPHVRAATLFSIACLLLFFAFIYRVLNNRTVHVNRKPTKEEAFTIAQAFVKERLRMPSTANFAGKYQQAEADTAQNKYHIVSAVSTQNLTGKQVKVNWSINMHYTGGDWSDKTSWKVEQLSFDPQP